MFQNLSPLDHRYRISNPALFSILSEYLSENASVQYELKVEAALLKVFARRFFPQEVASLTQKIDDAICSITPEKVYKEEQHTQHHIRALVEVMKNHIPQSMRNYVHLGATSMDIVDTAFALRLKDLSKQVMIPLLALVVQKLIEISEKHDNTLQIARTHGQFALPITFGYAISEYIARFGALIPSLQARANELQGKFSGAVGGYHAMKIIVSDPEILETEILGELHIKRSDFASQIVPPESTTRLLFEYSLALGIAANLADDIRHLQRSEISELKESFSHDQVGSSTMPHKKNPWNCEHIKSLWKTFSPRILSFLMDQISEHQRDLTNSASMRFSSEFLAGCITAIVRTKSVLDTLQINQYKMKENLLRAGDQILAEPLYILLSLSSSSTSYQEIKSATLQAESTGKSLLEILQSIPSLWTTLSTQAEKTGIHSLSDFLKNPAKYLGKVQERGQAIRKKYRIIVQEIDIPSSLQAIF